MHSSLKTAGAVCLVAGLVSTWDVGTAQAAPYTFTGEITPTHDLSDVYFLFSVGTCSPGGGVFAQKISDFLPANTTTPFNLSFDSIPDGLGAGYGYAIAGLYDTSNGGVSLSYDPSWAADTLAVSPAPEWNGYWLPIGGSIMSFAYESDVATALQSGLSTGAPFDPGQSPFPGISTDPFAPSTFTFVNFSGASNGGSGFIVEVVPEPASLSLMAAGTAFLLLGRFRKQNADCSHNDELVSCFSAPAS